MHCKRVLSLCTTAVLLACLVLGGSACGWLFSHGPPQGHERMNYFSCTESNVGPILDVTWAGLNLVGGIIGYASQGSNSISGPIGLAEFSIWFLSGSDGFRKSRQCRAAKQQLADRLAAGRAPVAGQPAVSQPGPVQPTAPRPAPAQPTMAPPTPAQPAAPVPTPVQPTVPPRAAEQPPARISAPQPPAAPPVVRVVVVSPAEDSLSVGQTVQLAATARSSNGVAVPDKTFTWSSSNDAVASVSNAGLVTARAVGLAVIAAKTDSVVGRARVMVLAPH
jgi:hypothetical protein